MAIKWNINQFTIVNKLKNGRTFSDRDFDYIAFFCLLKEENYHYLPKGYDLLLSLRSSATRFLSEHDLKQILNTSRENNSTKNLTGLLIYMDGNIIQILEGDKETVQKVFKSISLDNRHKGIIKIKDGFYEERIFPDWNMGFKVISKQQATTITGYKDLNSFRSLTDEKIDKHPALVLLNSFIKSNRLL